MLTFCNYCTRSAPLPLACVASVGTLPSASLLFKSLAECSGRRAPSAAAGTRHDGGPLVLCQQRFLGSWREHSGFARRRCQRRTQLECSRNAVVRQLCLKLGTFAYEDIEGVIQYSDRKHHGTSGRSFCCSRAGRGAPKNCATMVCVFECKGVAGSIYIGKIPHQVSRWQFGDRVSRW